MSPTFQHSLCEPSYSTNSSFPTGIYVGGSFLDGSHRTTFPVVDAATGKVIARVAAGAEADVNLAVETARGAFESYWGFHVSASKRGQALFQLADAMERVQDELAALVALNNDQPLEWAKNIDVPQAIAIFRYFADWVQKNVDEAPVGVVGEIKRDSSIMSFAYTVAPVLACGNTLILKPSQHNVLPILRMCTLFEESGFPSGVVNIVPGIDQTVGQAIAAHVGIDKISFELAASVDVGTVGTNGAEMRRLPAERRRNISMGGMLRSACTRKNAGLGPIQHGDDGVGETIEWVVMGMLLVLFYSLLMEKC